MNGINYKKNVALRHVEIKMNNNLTLHQQQMIEYWKHWWESEGQIEELEKLFEDNMCVEENWDKLFKKASLGPKYKRPNIRKRHREEPIKPPPGFEHFSVNDEPEYKKK